MRPKDIASGKHHYQSIIRTHGGPHWISIDKLSVVPPYWHHRWCQSDKQRCKTIPYSPIHGEKLEVQGKKNKKKYLLTWLNQWKHFTPFLVSIDGFLVHEAKLTIKQISRSLVLFRYFIRLSIFDFKYLIRSIKNGLDFVLKVTVWHKL